MRRRGIVLAVAVAGTLAACSSSDAADPAPTAVAPTTIATTTSAPPTSAASSTTDAPTTTLDPEATLAAEVEADLLEAFELGRKALQDPFDEDAARAALDRRLGVIADDLVSSLADYRAKNYALRPNEATPASVVVEQTPEFVGDDQEVAEVQICEVNSWIVIEVGAGPGGTDAVVDSSVLASRATVFMRDVDGTWRFEGSSLIAEWEGATECGSD